MSFQPFFCEAMGSVNFNKVALQHLRINRHRRPRSPVGVDLPVWRRAVQVGDLVDGFAVP